MWNNSYLTGHEIAPATVVNASKFILLATKIQNLALATRTLQVPYILLLWTVPLNKA